MTPVTIILNPCAGRGRGARGRAQVQTIFPNARILLSEYPGHAEILAREAARNGEILVAAGGDGTLGEVLNGAWGSGAMLGVLPLGTGNDFARTLGLNGLETAIAALQNTKTRRVDVGVCRAEKGERFFLNVCGAGFDAQVAARINTQRFHPVLRYLRGVPAYLQAVGAQLWRMQSAPMVLKIDGQNFERRAVLVAIANAKSYGGGMKVAPDALVDDGLLDVVTIGDVGRFDFARTFPRVFAGAHLSHPQVEVFRGKEIEIEGDFPLLCDGETIGNLPARFEIRASALEFVAP